LCHFKNTGAIITTAIIWWVGGRKGISAVKPRAAAMITTSHIECKVVNGEAGASVEGGAV